jgi:hypothetical protein
MHTGCCAALATAASAQTIRGRVFLPDSVTSAPGIVVIATGPGGVTAARALSTSTGDYLLQLKAPGTYDVRALRIGFRPAIVPGVVVGANATRVQNIVLSSLPVAIAGMDVRVSGDCTLKGRDGQTFLQLWEQARAALAATQLWELSGSLDVHLIRVTGHIDAPAPYTDSAFATVDTATARESIVDRAFAATSPETVAVRGYVRTRPDGGIVYDMPNAETLLSDQFGGGHCFTIHKHDERKDWIGLGFTPRRTQDGIAGVRGVLWLERATAELRRLDFEYVNLTVAEYQICDRKPYIPITPERLKEVPPFTQPQPSCQTSRNDRSNRLGLGGHADFVRLPSGEWIIASWMVRTPPDEGRYRALPWRVRTVKRMSERCWVGPDCHTIIVMHPRLVTDIGAISRVTRDGVELYRSDSGAALIAAMSAKRAGDHPAAFEGTVTDADGRPLANAVIQTEDPGRATLTDSSGAFRLRLLPAETIGLSVRCRGFDTLRFRLPLLRDSTRRATLSLARDSTRSASTNCASVNR